MALGRVAWLLQRAGFVPIVLGQTRSPSGRGWHVELDVAPTPTPLEVVALQAILGSDRGREACNLHRARMIVGGRVRGWWAERWNVLYAERGRRRRGTIAR